MYKNFMENSLRTFFIHSFPDKLKENCVSSFYRRLTEMQKKKKKYMEKEKF